MSAAIAGDCRGGHETSCPERIFLGDAGLNGGYAELVCVDADAALKVPAGISAEEAAIVACTIGTELNAVRDVGRVRLGERVLVTGAGGGLGLHGVQLSRLAGAFTIAVTTTAAKAARIREAGADEVIVVERGEDFSGEVRRLTGGRGVDAVIDNVGSPVFEAVRRSTADGGRIVLVGQLTGEFVAINPAQLFLRNISILSAKGVSRSQLADALDLVARRRIKPVGRAASIGWRMPPRRTAWSRPVCRPGGSVPARRAVGTRDSDASGKIVTLHAYPEGVRRSIRKDEPSPADEALTLDLAAARYCARHDDSRARDEHAQPRAVRTSSTRR